MDRIELRRAHGLPLFIFYGQGTILGAGIYPLIGEVAGSAGIVSTLLLCSGGFLLIKLGEVILQ